MAYKLTHYKYTIYFISHFMKYNISILILISFASCFMHKQTSSSVRQSDSLRQISRLAIQSTRIPESRASLSIPVGTLKELPTGAAFVQKGGQATAEIRFLRDTLFVYATCDSLQAQVYQYEEETEQLHARLENNQTKKSQNSHIGFWIFGVLFLISFFFGWRWSKAF